MKKLVTALGAIALFCVSGYAASARTVIITHPHHHHHYFHPHHRLVIIKHRH